jgi:hypothetical protein
MSLLFTLPPLLSDALYNLLLFLYPQPPPATSVRTKKLKVLCLGLPRSGTESLATALRHLGYDRVSHGLEWWIERPEISPVYYKLAVLRAQNRLPGPKELREDYFDKILGDYEALTDVPAVWFSKGLLEAYPEAQVIINRRTDVKAWKESFRQAIAEPMLYAWDYWWASWFEPTIFWSMGLTWRCHTTELFEGNVEKNAERAHEGHYERLEAYLQEKGRSYLRWSVQEGWQPLCQFLGHKVPEGEKFPSGNVPDAFLQKIMSVGAARFRRAWWTAGIVGGTVGAVVVGAVAWQYRYG